MGGGKHLVSETTNIRIKFEKTGKLQFISHLDLCRTMKTAMVRARIPVWYSEGFNPHPKMVFALPLSIGTESLCEYMDIKITEDMSPEKILKQLNEVTADELKITAVYTPVLKFGDIAWAEYVIEFNTPDISGAGPMFAKPFLVMKRSKTGEKETDILPLIRRFDIKGGEMKVLLSAESSRYLNPEYIAAAVSARFGIPDHSILRTDLYLEDGVTVFG